ncbi:pin domain-like protein [Lichtheimia corymbifera JMRC:FSU:9682]|uniref:U three protein 23 n=1 Tax=Lichtheimia corymbifera JMRC:FSU:9682 TaxID=1263082 RepID=A0A068SAT8_9FUNG|nr:pin domain-like protein [Lichtheimia corymbifera JMRC:FSU:9682]
MRPKTQRAYRRTMHSYSLGFGFRPPYQLLVDADFCLEASKQKIDMATELENTFQEPTKTFITECSIQELRKQQGPAAAGANGLARKFERRRCPHTHQPIASADCVAQVIGPENKYNYCVGSQNVELRNKLREIPGIPMFYVKSHMIIMEMMSKKSKEAIKKLEQEKMLPSAKENEKLKSAKMIASTKEEEPKKKKKTKGVNPLACKKSTKIPPPPPKKRKRELEEKEKKKKAKKEEDEEKEPSVIEPTPEKQEDTGADDTEEKKKKRRRRKKTKKTDAEQQVTPNPEENSSNNNNDVEEQ